MPIPLQEFVKQLEDSRILASDTLQDFLPPRRDPKDSEDLARELVRQKKLTKFQAEEVWRGRGKSLVLGNYTILDKIGAGGMGQVFKAEHRRMRRVVAVKMLPDAMLKNAAVVARFEREVMAAAKLNHPNIVTAFDADNANGVHLLIMEYVEGTDLAALVKKNGPCAVEQAVNYILQAARGLEAAHALGIVHRDIKPANLLLDQKGVVKILDMGLARLSADADLGKQAELTNTGAIMGTVDYMAPEQALDTKTADARADVYSLGCSLFYLLTGQATYQGDTLMKKLLAHREQPIPSIRTIRPEVPEQIDAVYRQMVAKRIEDRYQTMTELIVDLEALGTQQEPTADAPLSLGSSADTGLTDFFRDIAPSEPEPVRRLKSAGLFIGTDKKQFLLIGGIIGVLVLVGGISFNMRTKGGARAVTVNEPDDKEQVRRSATNIDATGEGGTRVANAKSPAETVNDPAFQKWIKQVWVMPASDQVKAVAAKLRQLNPGFDGNVTPIIVNGTVKTLSVVTNNVTNIAPVRALELLSTLDCSGSEPGLGRLSDLSPLQGLRLDSLNVSNTQVADLSTLAGIPLSTLYCNNTPLGDLKPMRELPSVLRLHCNDTQIADLSPLAGSQLQNLSCSRTQVSDLSPLRELPLIAVEFGGTSVADLTPLQGMKLTQLMCQGTPVVDLTPLAEMTSLELLFIDDASVSDLSPLKGLLLKTMHCVGTRVSDLSPLEGMPLTMLVIERTRVTDLSPIRGMPLYGIYFHDFRPERDGEILRSLKGTLQEINYRPAANFWRDFEAEEAAIATWKKQVAAMPAEQQVRAVAARLREFNPKFDGKVDHKVENGQVIALEFVSDNITDISPVRAFVGLQTLSCPGSAAGQGLLAELWPLRGTAVTHLNVSRTAVTDLSPLAGLPLTHLWCEVSLPRDVEILRTMKRLETINNQPAAEFWKEVETR